MPSTAQQKADVAGLKVGDLIMIVPPPLPGADFLPPVKVLPLMGLSMPDRFKNPDEKGKDKLGYRCCEIDQACVVSNEARFGYEHIQDPDNANAVALAQLQPSQAP